MLPKQPNSNVEGTFIPPDNIWQTSNDNIPSVNMNLKFIKSSKGKDQLLLDGNLFYKEKVNRTGDTFWKCTAYYKVKRCPSRAITNDGALVNSTVHNHVINSVYKEQKQNRENDNLSVINDFSDSNKTLDYTATTPLSNNDGGEESADDFKESNEKPESEEDSKNSDEENAFSEDSNNCLHNIYKRKYIYAGRAELSPRYKKVKPDTTIEYDPNELVDQLRLLVTEMMAGNINHLDEVQTIIKELRRRGYIE